VIAFRTLHRVRSSLWLVPALCVVAGVALSVGTISIDHALGTGVVPRELVGGPDAALAILGTIATAMVTLAALVLTITMVVVQLAMGQFSPRIVRTILQDTTSQAAIGLFVGTFTHATLTMREVRFGGEASVPGIAILTAFVLVIASIIMLVYYVHHLGQSLRVAALIELVGDEMRGLVDELYPGAPDAVAEPGTIATRCSGVVFHVDIDRLVEVARAARCTLHLVPAIGDFLPAGAPLVRVTPPGARVDGHEILTRIDLGPERTLNQDLAYGLRMLVDIAERSISEPMLDPTTAVQAIDRMHDCLRLLARRPFPDGLHRDRDGEVRLVMPTMDWEGYVALAFDEVIRAGAASPQIPRRLAAALDDLIAVAPPDRLPALERRRRMLDDADDVPLVADLQGIGSGRDVSARAAT
jgi:uncharacterized membrane protein